MEFSLVLAYLFLDKQCTGHTQTNGAVSEVDKKCISRPTRAQHLSTAGTVQVSHALPVVRF
jgi:hypothetical protein